MTTEAVSNVEELDAPTNNNNDSTNNPDSVPVLDLALPWVRTAHAKRRGRKVPVTHWMRQPTLSQLQARDAANPYRSQAVNEDEDQILAEVTGGFDAKLYDQLVLETKGYKQNVLSENQSPEDRREALKGANIPKQHKIDMLRSALAVRAEVVWDGVEETEGDDDETFTWGDNVEYRVRVEFGDQSQFIAYVTMREPKQTELDDFTAASTDMRLEKGQRKPVTKIQVKLAPAVELFDKMITGAEGLLVNGDPFDHTNPAHLRLLNAYAKREVLDKVMKETRLDMGNS